MARQMILVGFLQAQNCTTLASSWRHPEGRTDFTTAAYFQRIGQVMEVGKFHLAFFDDRLAMPDLYGGDHAHTVENGIRCVKLDPVTVLMAMAAKTERLGLGATCSTTYYEPFHVARLFQTVDLMTSGRAAWNIVTSVNDGEALNMGVDAHMEHDLRYDRADEFMEVVLGHWDSWEDDALVVDKRRGLFANPDKVHRLDHRGRFFHSRGPFTVTRSPQGHPVLIQAGSSGRGRRFSAHWAETVFVAYPSFEEGKRIYAATKADIARHNRDPDSVSLNTIAYPVSAATKAEAEDKMALIETLYREVDGLSLLSEALNFDFAKKGLDEPFTEDELAGMSGMQAMRDHVVRDSGKRAPTARDFLAITRRGRPGQAVVGGPKEIADRLEQWFVEGVCDGYVLGGTHIPGTYEDFVRFVVPELQRRGLYHTEYEGATLRENMGIPRPVPGAWKNNVAEEATS
jgi:FMN-dependent oxidoreductase (nitrilotriacetate monooxygenase family)